MKKYLHPFIIVSTFITLVFTQKAQAQAPQSMTYQSVLRNSGNTLLSNTTVSSKISILQGTSNGTVVYSEIHRATTNANGLYDRGGDNRFTVNWPNAAPLAFFIENTNVKNFTIQHPLDENKWLLHACAEGPTADVFYRGEGQLVNGKCEIELPSYFESIALEEGRNVFLTPILEGDDYLAANLCSSRIVNGKFNVSATGGYVVNDQKFYWRVDAIRKNTEFNVEPTKESVTIMGDGPYTYSIPN
jgi:hypothetical protein